VIDNLKHMRAIKMLVIALALQLVVAAQAQTLVTVTNTVWKYLADGVDQGTDWKNSGFDDSTWLSGRGLFGNDTTIAGYTAVGGFATTINGTGSTPAGPQTAYYRVHFNWVGTTAGVVFTTTNYIDDGFVMYLNGTEILRYNITADPVAYTTGADTANPAGEGVAVVRTILLDTNVVNPLVAGDNVLAVEVHQTAAASSDHVWGMSLRASQISAPCTDNIQPTNRVIQVRRDTTFTVVEQCAIPAADIQWYRNVGLGEEAIAGATGASYTLTNATAADAGVYYARLSNSGGSVDSRQATLTVNPDNDAPIFLEATVVGPGLNTFRLITDEPLCGDSLACGSDYTFQFNWQINQSDNTSIDLGVATVVQINATTYEFTTSAPRDPTKQYQITVTPIFGEVSDLGGIFVAPGTFAETAITLTFSQGDANGYTGTQDAEIHSNASADTPLGTLTQMGSDLDDAGIAQSLVRFDNIFGAGANQVPPGSLIVSATLTLNQIDPGSEIRLHRMLVTWDQASVTWNSLTDGVAADGVEATTAFDASKAAGVANGAITLDVTASLQAWANGQPNHGWAFLSQGTDGWDANTSESGATTAPILTVAYETVPCVGLPTITAQPPANVAATEFQPFSISVGLNNACGTLQWTKNNVDIPGANASTYSVASASPADAGTYRLVATNPGGSVTSAGAVVTVSGDTNRPHVTRVASSVNGTTITVQFNEAVSAATAQNAANYTLIPAVAVSSAVLGANNTVTLTTAARSVGTAYSLRIAGITDTAGTPNLLDPNPTIVALTSSSVVSGAGFGGTWFYNSNNLDGVAWNTVGYVPDATWGTGPAAFGIETGAGVIAAAPTPINTALSANSVAPGDALTTTYFRKDIVLPALPAGASYYICHYTDDGHITYLDGVEINRFGMPAGPVTFTTRSTGVPNGGEASMRSFAFTAAPGPHVLAVELHQAGATSSDVWFDMEVRIVNRATPSLAISRNTTPAGSLKVGWNADANWLLRGSATVDGLYNTVAIPAGTAQGMFIVPPAAAGTNNNFYTLDFICLP